MAEPTLRQKQAFKTTLQNIAEGGSLEMTKIMEESGYSKATAHNPQKNLTSKDGWNKLMASVDDTGVLENVLGIALSKDDKRASLAAAKMIFDLKDRFPAGKLKITAYQEELNDLT